VSLPARLDTVVAAVSVYDGDDVAAVPLARLVCVTALVVALSACVGASAPASQTPVPSVAESALTTPTATPTPSPERATPPSIAVATMGAIPTRFRYAVVSWAETRVWLVDLQGRVAPRLAIRLEHMGNGELTASSNGDVIVLSAPGARGHRAVHVVRPTTGTRTVMYDEPDAQVGGTPIVTRAGDRYAFAKQLAGVNGSPGGSADLGLWIGPTDGGAPRRVIAGGGSAGPVPLAWSPDGRWLAFARGMEISVLAPDGSERRAGVGVDASWLGMALLVARGTAAPSGIDRYEVGTGVLREELRTTGRVNWVFGDPTGRRYAYVERTGTEDLLTAGTVWLREAAGGAARSLGAHPLGDIEWSSDGVALTGLTGGDDSVTDVFDLLGGNGVRLCRRSDSLPQASAGGCV
jgi:hypothetical protein